LDFASLDFQEFQCAPSMADYATLSVDSRIG
jgi:hypothetical protein